MVSLNKLRRLCYSNDLLFVETQYDLPNIKGVNKLYNHVMVPRNVLSKCPAGIRIKGKHLPQQPTISIMSR